MIKCIFDSQSAINLSRVITAFSAAVFVIIKKGRSKGGMQIDEKKEDVYPTDI